jgi:MFS family permease
MWKQYRELPRAVHVLCFGTLINRAGSFFVVFLTIYLSEQLGFGITFATRCMGIFGAGSIVASLLGGHLADYYGRRVVMLVSLFGGAAILALFGSLQSRATIMVAIFCYAVLINAYRPAASAMIGDLVGPKQRPHAFRLMYVAINLGFACGAAVGGKLASHSFSLLFWGDALTTSIYAFIILLAVAETLPARSPLAVAVEPNGSGDSAEPTISAGQAALHVVRDWPFVLFCTCTILVGAVFVQSFSTLPIFLQSLRIKAETYGYVISLNGLLIVLLQLPLTAVLCRFDRMKIIIVGTMTIGAGFCLNALASHPWHFAGAVAVWTLGEMMQFPFTSAVVADLAPLSLRGRYMGVFNMSFATAMMLGPPLGGEVLARLGADALWFGGAGVAAMAVLLYILIYRPIHERRLLDDG